MPNFTEMRVKVVASIYAGRYGKHTDGHGVYNLRFSSLKMRHNRGQKILNL